MSLSDVIVSALLLLGAGFLLLAAIGIVRMPDLFSRLQAAAKASTLGAGFVVIALAIFFNDIGISARALLIIAFLFLTTPVAAHVISRAAYFIGVPLWEKTIIDELRGNYDPKTHQLGRPKDLDNP